MGILQCREHGLVGFKEGCAHFHRDVKNRRYYSYTGIGGVIWVCDLCLPDFQTYQNLTPIDWNNIDFEDDEKNEIYWEAYDKLENRKAICSECEAEAKIWQARSGGKPDPIPVFEYTLRDKDSSEISILIEQLKSKFTFRASTKPGQSLSLYVRPGKFTFPLTISVYYFISEQKQDEVIDTIESFLHGKEKHQALLKFYEAENWIVRNNGGHLGAEKLLREIHINY